MTQDIFALLSRRISGEHKRRSFYRKLNLQDYEYQNEEELWYKKIHGPEEAIYNVLNQWLKKKGTSSVKVLYDALCEADFKNLGNDLITICAANVRLENCPHNTVTSERAGVHQTAKKHMICN